jgi:D-threo-aldose 1-dehydrogenase
MGYQAAYEVPMDPLSKRRLGTSKLEVTVLGLGGAPLVGVRAKLPGSQARAAIEAAYDAGLRLFDTSPFYGIGLSEHRMGSVLQEKPAHDFVLSTKVGRYLVPEAPEKVDHRTFQGTLNMRLVLDYSYDGVLRAVDQSLQRLGLDRVDVLHIHDIDIWSHGSREAYEKRFAEAMDGAYRAVHRLRAQGVVGAIGIGVNEIEPCLRAASAGDFDCFMLAGRYTLLNQDALGELLPLMERKGMRMLIAAPYNSGILATGAVPGARYAYQPASPEIMARVAAIEAVGRRHFVPLQAAALQFPLGHPAVAAVVPGAVSAREVEHNVALMRHAIPAAFWAELKDQKLLPAECPVPG